MDKLDALERGYLNKLNFMNNTKYKSKHFAEWGTDKLKMDIRADEIVYAVDGVFVAINPKGVS